MKDSALADAVRLDHRTASLSPADRALADFAESLTHRPGVGGRERVGALREAGFDDPAILRAAELVAYFNLVNRLALGLGVELEPGLAARRASDAHRLEKLTLVYNADSGIGATFVDTTKKLLMSEGCVLCSITHGLVGEKQEWISCKEALGVPVDYLHRDELTPSLKIVVAGNIPAIVAHAEGGSHLLLLGAADLAECRGRVSRLEEVIRQRAAMLGLRLA